MTWNIHTADVLTTLADIPDNSIDACLTDPPYGLSAPPDMAEVLSAWLAGEKYEAGSPRKGKKECAANFVGRPVVNDALGSDTSGSEKFIPFSISAHSVGLAVLSAVNLDNQGQSGEIEVNHEGTSGPLENLLMNEGYANLVKALSDGKFCFRVPEALTRCIGICSCFTEQCQGAFRVLVRLGDDAPSEAQGSTGVMALGRAEAIAVLAFDMTGRTGMLSPAQPADKDLACFLLVSAQDVGAGAGASGLPAPSQSMGGSGIQSATDNAGSLLDRAALANVATCPTTALDPTLNGVKVNSTGFTLLLHDALLYRLRNPIKASKGFMSKEWDAQVPGPDVWREVYRVLKPGASAFVFAGDRTQDLMGLALRLAGFELKGVTAYLYGSGFPKSMNLSRAVDDHLGGDRPVIGEAPHQAKFQDAGNGGYNNRTGENGRPPTYPLTGSGTPEATAWEGYGTAQKPGFEPAIRVMKPLEGTYAANALKWGVAGINVDAGRIDFDGAQDERTAKTKNKHADFGSGPMTNAVYGEFKRDRDNYDPSGRWPTNVVVDEHTAAQLGDFSRYFYTAKPTREERDAGLAGSLPVTEGSDSSALRDGKRSGGEMTNRKEGSAGLNSPRAGAGRLGGRYNTHPCVKPLALTRYLATLLLPPARASDPRRIIVPFSGSGSEMIGALLAGWDDIVGIDLEPEYVAIAQARLTYWAAINTPKSKPGGQISLFDAAMLGREGA